MVCQRGGFNAVAMKYLYRKNEYWFCVCDAISCQYCGVYSGPTHNIGWKYWGLQKLFWQRLKSWTIYVCLPVLKYRRHFSRRIICYKNFSLQWGQSEIDVPTPMIHACQFVIKAFFRWFWGIFSLRCYDIMIINDVMTKSLSTFYERV